MNNKSGKREREHFRGREILRVTWVGFWVNALLSCVKILAGFLGNSRALVADGVHSLSDLATDVIILIGTPFWSAPPDADHAYGHGRLESLFSFIIGLLLAAAGLGIAYEAIIRIQSSPDSPAGSILALCVALFSVVSKEILYRWTRTKAQMLKSEAVEANAWNHRADALSSLPVAVAIALSMWFPALAVADLLGSILVSGFILYAAWGICKNAMNSLTDRGCEPALREAIIAYALDVEGVRAVHGLRTRYVGQGLLLDMHACVDGDISVAQADIIIHRLEDALYADKAAEALGVEIFDVVIHIDPYPC